MYEFLIPSVLVAALIGSNAVITYAIGRSAFYSSRQKAVQIGLVWLLPVFGSLLVGGVLWSNYDRSPSRPPADLDAGAVVGTGDPISYEQ